MKKKNACDEQLLGQRHEPAEAQEKPGDFKSAARMIGFSKREIEQMEKLYLSGSKEAKNEHR